MHANKNESTHRVCVSFYIFTKVSEIENVASLQSKDVMCSHLHTLWRKCKRDTFSNDAILATYRGC